MLCARVEVVPGRLRGRDAALDHSFQPPHLASAIVLECIPVNEGVEARCVRGQSAFSNAVKRVRGCGHVAPVFGVAGDDAVELRHMRETGTKNFPEKLLGLLYLSGGQKSIEKFCVHDPRGYHSRLVHPHEHLFGTGQRLCLHVALQQRGEGGGVRLQICCENFLHGVLGLKHLASFCVLANQRGGRVKVEFVCGQFLAQSVDPIVVTLLGVADEEFSQRVGVGLHVCRYHPMAHLLSSNHVSTLDMDTNKRIEQLCLQIGLVII